MRGAVVQYKPPKKSVDAGREGLRELVLQAASSEVDLIVCPEMAVSGYVFSGPEDIRPYAEPAQGQTFQMLSPIARKHGTWIVCGFAEIDGDRLFNSALVIDHTGELVGVYRKIHLYDADKPWAEPGTQRMLFETPFGTMAPAICMDLNDPKLWRWLVLNQPDVLAFCCNWLNEGDPIDAYWKWCTQYWSGWFLGANTWGWDEGTEFRGESAIISPQKRTMVCAPIVGNGVFAVRELEQSS